MLSFTDSRAGVAKISNNMQQDLERNWFRSFIYHLVRSDPNLQQDYRQIENAWSMNPNSRAVQIHDYWTKFNTTFVDDFPLANGGQSKLLRLFFLKHMNTFGTSLANLGLIRTKYRCMKIFRSLHLFGKNDFVNRPEDEVLQEWKNFLTIFINIVFGSEWFDTFADLCEWTYEDLKIRW